ncbi:GNAT family N-acetyltransferase [uncultured Ruegeria sp.]|uniref:GNAT family N-acetyltransferase n=1 Tax=uncultured Ruegeria sp. TaxID=259304 RepID=UPI0026350CD4|nr:GNAT family N-acetyltransferase [uncultured Ruegeria sp.]
MQISQHSKITEASVDDAENPTKLIDIAGEGIPTWLWSESTGDSKSVLEVGRERAMRESGGFSYRNARVAYSNSATLGMVLSYPIDKAPEGNLDELPAALAPFVALERRLVGTWYVNALAVFPRFRGHGLGTELLRAAET